MLNAGDAEAFLVARFGRRVSEVSAVGQGAWSRAYGFRRDGAEYIVRFSAHDEDFHKDRVAARYSSPDLPIPAVIEIDETHGGFFAISERASGRYLDDLGEEGMRLMLPSLFAALDAARRVELTSSTGYGSWGVDGNAPHVSWRAALLAI